MQRRIVEPADLSGSALDELKSWLGVSRANEDALLTDLLHSCLAVCEAFTGQLPIRQSIEERLPARAGSYRLCSGPVAALLSAEMVGQDQTRTAIDPSRYEFAVDAHGCGTFELLDDVEEPVIALTVSAGRGASWDEIPAPLKQGIIRLCAHYYRDRDRTGGEKVASAPPASVSALWRPFQIMRLA